MPTKPVEFKESKEEEKAFEQRCQASLDFVKFICVFGSSNIMEHIEKTGGWVLTLPYRFYSIATAYKKYTNTAAFDKDLPANILYDVKRQSRIEDIRKPNRINPYKPSQRIKEPGWYYHVEDYETIQNLDKHILSSKTPFDPLKDPRFNLDIEKIRLLRLIIRTMDARFGNCHAKAALVTDYLWRQPLGFNRIEGFSMESFDHVFVVVNRKQGSNSKDFSTWGDDCWVIDPWYNTFYPAKEFKKQIEKIKLFGDQQDQALETLGLEVQKIAEMDVTRVKEILWDIDPQIHHYPAYEEGMGIYDYYTFHNTEYDEEDKAEHRETFQHCLKGENSVTNPDVRNKFFKSKTANETKQENHQDQPDPQDQTNQQTKKPPTQSS